MTRILGAGLGLLTANGALAQVTISGPQPSAPPAIRDIRPPLDVFPYPTWMVVTAGAIALLLVALMASFIVRAMRNRPKPAPPTPKEIALKQLKQAAEDVDRKEPYAFSIQVSDILRKYVSAQYRLHATEQTSPEFLADAAKSPHFTGADKRLLADFLEHCDLIKFARIDATQADSRALLEQAVRFVKNEPVATTPSVEVLA